MNKHTSLQPLFTESYKAFMLGQFEGQYILSMAKMFHLDSKAESIISASTKFDHTKELYKNYKYISDNKNDANKIADYLCALNWLGGAYSYLSNHPEIATRYCIEIPKPVLEDVIDYYYFAYNFLNDKFYNDRTINDNIKSAVYRIND